MSARTEASGGGLVSRPGVQAAGVGVPIGRAAELSGVSRKMIRYYEARGLLGRADRDASNYRVFDAAAVGALRLIGGARAFGFSVAEIAKLLELWRDPTRASADVKRVAVDHVAQLDRRIAALQELKAAVEQMAAHCHGDERPDCAILEGLGDPSPCSGALRRRLPPC